MKRQRGASLVVVMITLSIMLVAVASFFRTTNGTLNIVGNLGFKQNATSVGDQGVENARAWIASRTPVDLIAVQSDSGYFPTWGNNFDARTYDWEADGNSVQLTPDDDNLGNTVRYVIHRMCKVSGTITALGQQCVLRTPDNESKAVGNNIAQGGVNRPYYRITTRVQGPRNTLSYVEVMVY